MRLDFFQVAWLAVRKPGWVRAGGVCARSGVQCSAELFSRAVRTTD